MQTTLNIRGKNRMNLPEGLLQSFIEARTKEREICSMSEGLGRRVAERLEEELNREFRDQWGEAVFPSLNGYDRENTCVRTCVITDIKVVWNTVANKFHVEVALFGSPKPSEDIKLTKEEKKTLDLLMDQFEEMAQGEKGSHYMIEKHNEHLRGQKNALNVLRNLGWWVEAEDIEYLLSHVCTFRFSDESGHYDLDDFYPSYKLKVEDE